MLIEAASDLKVPKISFTEFPIDSFSAYTSHYDGYDQDAGLLVSFIG